ncbi:MAG: L,D-transpeptidase family protein [Clostridium sp.]|nr:L,D-transpeptidase family protein [Prevotella sp.]MCM1428744.1 L,D-transpeptidase family protein [Clostridium sp.]MCM1475119.1 L,D-transpeptidase family protein [Muribaculaceae bacterium]
MKFKLIFFTYTLFIASVIMLFVASGCTKSKPGSTVDSGYSAPLGPEAIAMNDSVRKADSIAEAKKGIQFANSEEALNWMKKSGHWDKYQSGILPEMARDVLPYFTKIVNNPHSKFIIADKNTMHVYLYDKYGREIDRYGMACSRYYGTKHRKGDNRTPDGIFTAEGIYDSTSWLYTDDSGYTSPAKGVYGPIFIRVDVPNTRSIGIHGTSSPGSIGRRASHGCMRLNNESIKKLAPQAEVGMVIIISPGPADIAVNEREGYSIPSVVVVPGQPRAVKGAAPKYNMPAKKSAAPEDSVPAEQVSPAELSPLENQPAEQPLPADQTPSAPSTPSTPQTPSTPVSPAEPAQ